MSTLRLGLTGATAAELVGLHHSAEQQFVPPSITAKEQSPNNPQGMSLCLPTYVFHLVSGVMSSLNTNCELTGQECWLSYPLPAGV